MTEDQPFYVGVNNPRFKGVSLDGYLPALEPKVELPENPRIPQPVINITYQVEGVDTPAFKEMREQIHRLEGRLHKYFDQKKHSKEIPL